MLPVSVLKVTTSCRDVNEVHDPICDSVILVKDGCCRLVVKEKGSKKVSDTLDRPRILFDILLRVIIIYVGM